MDKIWNGTLNVTIVLENTSTEYLLPIYRNSYFPLHFPAIVEYFARIQPEINNHPVWLEYKGTPLQWNLPVGVLYDLMMLPQHDQWCLTLRYVLPYPGEAIIPFYTDPIDYEKSVKELLVNQLKQSCYVVNGTAKPIMHLSEANSVILWNSIKSHNYHQFKTINSLIVPSKCIRIPVKIYTPGQPSVIQAPIDAQYFGVPISFNDIIQKYLPEGTIPYIHGIDTSSVATMDLQQVWQAFKHLDNFLYVIAIQQSSP